MQHACWWSDNGVLVVGYGINISSWFSCYLNILMHENQSLIYHSFAHHQSFLLYAISCSICKNSFDEIDCVVWIFMHENLNKISTINDFTMNNYILITGILFWWRFVKEKGCYGISTIRLGHTYQYIFFRASLIIHPLCCNPWDVYGQETMPRHPLN
jgi:hypothetical protein